MLQRVYPELLLLAPLAMAQAPGGPTASFYIASKTGQILAVPADDRSTGVDATVVLDLPVHTDIESGITALAFHPDYVVNGRAFVAFGIERAPGDLVLRVAEFARQADGLSLADQRILLDIPKDNPEHFGGALAFGPDGYLYVSVGDDGNNLDGDPHPELAQDPASAYGTIMRLDVDTTGDTTPYGVPTDNPSFPEIGVSETWAIGFRNPWRISFDSESPHTLWVANVGSHVAEEIETVEMGGNHGWPACEGACTVSDDRFVDPVYSYPNQGGASVIGGYVYRGTALPELVGKYVFADFVSGEIKALDPALLPGEASNITSVISAGFNISSMAIDNAGELYVIGFSTGAVHRIVRNPEADSVSPPSQLSETGCFDSLAGGEPVPAPGVIDYAINQRFWSDGATKRRQLALPDAGVIDTSEPDNWQLPPGGVTIKHFYWNQQIIETRFLVRHDGGDYGGYTYAWDESGNDASLVPAEGQQRQLDGLACSLCALRVAPHRTGDLPLYRYSLMPLSSPRSM